MEVVRKLDHGYRGRCLPSKGILEETVLEEEARVK